AGMLEDEPVQPRGEIPQPKVSLGIRLRAEGCADRAHHGPRVVAILALQQDDALDRTAAREMHVAVRVDEHGGSVLARDAPPALLLLRGHAIRLSVAADQPDGPRGAFEDLEARHVRGADLAGLRIDAAGEEEREAKQEERAPHGANQGAMRG